MQNEKEANESIYKVVLEFFLACDTQNVIYYSSAKAAMNRRSQPSIHNNPILKTDAEYLSNVIWEDYKNLLWDQTMDIVSKKINLCIHNSVNKKVRPVRDIVALIQHCDEATLKAMYKNIQKQFEFDIHEIKVDNTRLINFVWHYFFLEACQKNQNCPKEIDKAYSDYNANSDQQYESYLLSERMTHRNLLNFVISSSIVDLAYKSTSLESYEAIKNSLKEESQQQRLQNQNQQPDSTKSTQEQKQQRLQPQPQLQNQNQQPQSAEESVHSAAVGLLADYQYHNNVNQFYKASDKTWNSHSIYDALLDALPDALPGHEYKSQIQQPQPQLEAQQKLDELEEIKQLQNQIQQESTQQPQSTQQQSDSTKSKLIHQEPEQSDSTKSKLIHQEPELVIQPEQIQQQLQNQNQPEIEQEQIQPEIQQQSTNVLMNFLNLICNFFKMTLPNMWQQICNQSNQNDQSINKRE